MYIGATIQPNQPVSDSHTAVLPRIEFIKPSDDFIDKLFKGDQDTFKQLLQGYPSESDRIEIAKIAAAQNGLDSSRFIQNYGITNQKVLIEIAKIAAAQIGWGTSKFIQNYGITDQKELIKIAKIAARNHGDLSEFIQNYGITDQKVLIKIAKIAATRCGGGVSRFIQNYGITDQKELIKIAKIAAAQNGLDTSRFIQNYGITNQKVLIEIAKIAAAQNGRRTSEFIHNYGITDQKALIDIAKIAAAQRGWGISEFIQNYGITDQKELIEIAKIAFFENPYQTLEHITNYNLTEDILPQLISSSLDIILTQRHTETYCRNKLNLILQFISDHLATDLADEPVFKKLQHLCDLECSHSEMLQKIKSVFISEVQTEEEVIALFVSAVINFDTYDWQQSSVEVSRAILEKLSGIPFKLPKDKLSPNSARELYSILIDIGDHFKKDLSFVQIDQSCWDKTLRGKVLEILVLLKAIDSLGGECKDIAVTPQNIQSMIEVLGTSLANLFEQKLDLTEVSKDSVLELQTIWGDLMPIFVLWGRLEANGNWKESLPCLRDIITNCINRTFKDYKYGVPAQLPFEQDFISVWRENPYRLDYVDPNKADAKTDSELLADVRVIVGSNLKNNLAVTAYNTWQNASVIMEGNISEVIKNITKEERPAALIKALIDAKDKERILELAEFILDRAEEYKLPKQIKSDITGIKSTLKPPRESKNSGYLVFNTITDDPKLLLTVGDLVDASSCQNYRTGSYVQTLPGYVEGGNIKAALSFVIPVSELNNYPGLTQAVRDDIDSVEVYFNAPKLEITFTLKTGKSFTHRFKKASRRHILRVGNNSGEPALLVERAYLQNHHIEAEIGRIALEFIRSFQLNIKAGDAIKGTRFPAARNPSGVYSDASGGVKVGEYKL